MRDRTERNKKLCRGEIERNEKIERKYKNYREMTEQRKGRKIERRGKRIDKREKRRGKWKKRKYR